MNRRLTMNLSRTLWQRFRSLWQSRAAKQEIDEELQFHLAMREQENLRAGMPPKEAARDARRRFGNLQNVREECREARGVSLGLTVWQDVCFGLRMLRKHPGFTAVMILTLALGVGVNTSMFSMLKHFLFADLPFPEPERLVRISEVDRTGERYNFQSSGDFVDERAQSTSFAGWGALHFGGNVNFSSPDSPAEALHSVYVTADFLPTLGIKPLAGRVFTAADEQAGSEGVVLLSQAFWQRRFNGDPQVVGRPLRLDGKGATVIGVVTVDDPLMFDGGVDIVRLLTFAPWQRQNHDNSWLEVIARLKPGTSLPQAKAELATIGQRLAHDYPKEHDFLNLQAEPLGRALMDGDGPKVIWMLMGLTVFVLLIACANLTNLQLSRVALRARELGIRAALGASRIRLARQLLTESVVVSLLGGALGAGLALGCNRLLSHRFLSEDDGTPLGIQIPLDGGGIAFALLVALLCALLVGIAPVWIMVRRDLNPLLKEDGRTLSAGLSRHRLQNAFIVAEVALALPLLLCLGLMTTEFINRALKAAGWRAEGLMVGDLTLAGGAYDSPQKQAAFLQRLAERAGALPGVQSVSIASCLPIRERNNCWRIEPEGAAVSKTKPLIWWHSVDGSYFQTVGITLRQGREFTLEELAHGGEVVIIHHGLAEKLWPGQNPIGKRISMVGQKEQLEVIGVINDLLDDGRFQGYRPQAGQWMSNPTLLVRAEGSPQALAPLLRRIVAELDPDLPLYQFQPVQELLRKLRTNETIIVSLIAGFGILGLLLATVGIYGVTSQVVSQRTGEFGIRMALGAPRRHVLWLVLRGGLKLGLCGTALGLAGSLTLLQGFRIFGSLFGNEDLKLTTICLIAAGTGLVLLAVTLAACWLPARRATRIDPMTALRCE